MREILFRGKYANSRKYVGGMYPDYGDWIYGDLLRIGEDAPLISRFWTRLVRKLQS